MSVLRYGAPLVTIALLTLIAALPWGLPSDYRFFLPLLPAVAIHYWSVRRDDLAIEWLAFLSGLVLDVLTQGPLGYWSLIYLLSRVMGLQSVRFSEAGQGVRILLYALALVVTATAAWAISSLYF
ncbi:MAG: rod shape-determining protein MreD, partial [Hyphomicrobium sp.]